MRNNYHDLRRGYLARSWCSVAPNSSDTAVAVGGFRTAIAGKGGKALAKNPFSTAITGAKGTATAGSQGLAIALSPGSSRDATGSASSGRDGIAVAANKAVAGDYGTAFAWDYAVVGDYGIAYSWRNARAGLKGVLVFMWYNVLSPNVTVCRVGENGILPNTDYHVDEYGQVRPCDLKEA